jgi:2-oxo-4-hydroxy-4-carboxy-5-ureidoimidazoline decarboxylase
MAFIIGRRVFWQSALAGGIAGLMPAVRAKARTTLDEVNRMDEAAFIQEFGNVYDSSSWVAKAAYAKRPFATVSALHQAFVDGFAGGQRDRQLKFFHDLPDLGEKGAAAIPDLEPADQAVLVALNKAYRANFDIAFTICARRTSTATIFSEYIRRMRNTLDAELDLAIQEQFYIARLRVAEAVTGPGIPKVYGDVSAHVLNSMIGMPAEGVAVEIHEVGSRSRKVGAATTNADGRAILIQDQPLPIGRYELRFSIGDYFRKAGALPGGQKPFLDVVPMRIQIAKPEDSYHFPLIAAPYGYSIHG